MHQWLKAQKTLRIRLQEMTRSMNEVCGIATLMPCMVRGAVRAVTKNPALQRNAEPGEVDRRVRAVHVLLLHTCDTYEAMHTLAPRLEAGVS